MGFPPPIPEIILFKEWKDTLDICVPVKYKAFLADGNNLPNFIKFQSNFKQFKIEQTNEMKPEKIMIKLLGILENYLIMNYLFFAINIQC